jgi:hypothetical protein
MDSMIKEYVRNYSDTFTETVNVDEERTVYQFDFFNLQRFVEQVVLRANELK